ncbi:hypothetical protein ACXM5X_02080 [Pseudomonas saponiphila]|uniref:Uncharacterized protein n=1 Tax=Pseudomonas saponiphila TaxID=556534 RepID=A0A1H4VJ82_9PSED|nr:hypothetical protein [Pseudomonas saponiphila]SEC81046.1 hypothetical protein SAMN05216178_4962 [Pseudomonas saponiphila]
MNTPRKWIVVPTSKDAMQRLDLDQCLPGDLEELALSAEQWTALCSSDLLPSLNHALGTLIDDYEDASIQGRAALATALSILTQTATAEDELIHKLIALNRLALERDTGLFFYF